MYRGYDIADIAEHSTYEDTAYLLLHGELPDGDAREAFRGELSDRALPDAITRAIDDSATQAAPMDMLRTAASMLSFGAEGQGAIDRASGLTAATRLIAKLPTAIAHHHRRRLGLEPVAPDPSLGYSENFLAMITGERPDARAARIFDIAMILHAEHEMNASTFAARVVAGTGADLTSAVVAAIAALSGPLHGGANAAAMELFEQWWLRRADARRGARLLEQKAKLFGFGHPLYRAYDPRAVILKQLSEELSRSADGPNWFAITDAAEQTVFEEEHSIRTSTSTRRRSTATSASRPISSRRSSPRAARRGGRRMCSSSTATTRSSVPRRPTSASHAAPTRKADDPRRRRGRGRSARGGGQGGRALAAASAVGRGARGVSACVGLPRAGGRLPRDRAVPLPHQDRAVAAGPGGRQPGRSRIVPARTRAALARPSGRGQRRPASAARAAHPRRQRGGAPPRGRVAEERLAASRHDPKLLASIGDDDEQPRELREAAAKVAQLLRRKGK